MNTRQQNLLIEELLRKTSVASYRDVSRDESERIARDFSEQRAVVFRLLIGEAREQYFNKLELEHLGLLSETEFIEFLRTLMHPAGMADDKNRELQGIVIQDAYKEVVDGGYIDESVVQLLQKFGSGLSPNFSGLEGELTTGVSQDIFRGVNIPQYGGTHAPTSAYFLNEREIPGRLKRYIEAVKESKVPVLKYNDEHLLNATSFQLATASISELKGVQNLRQAAAYAAMALSYLCFNPTSNKDRIPQGELIEIPQVIWRDLQGELGETNDKNGPKKNPLWKKTNEYNLVTMQSGSVYVLARKNGGWKMLNGNGLCPEYKALEGPLSSVGFKHISK